METAKNVGEEQFRPNAQNGQLLKKWSDLNRSHQKWILDITHKMYATKVEQTKQTIEYQKRRKLIDAVYGMVKAKGIMIPKCEVVRVLESRMRKWNKRFLESELKKRCQANEKGKPC